MSNQDRSARLRDACTFLFTPGDQPQRIATALHLETDVLILDLEDSVIAANKELAREAIVKVLSEHRSADGPLIVIRVNGFCSPEFELDVRAALSLNVDAIMVPKYIPGAESENMDAAIAAIERELGQTDLLQVIPLIESTVGVLKLISASTLPKRVLRLAFGAADLYADLGVSFSESGANSAFAMASLVMASVNSELAAPIDSPHFEIDDDLGLQRSSLFARDMGFGGKLCIHPKQLEIISHSFTRDTSDQNWATRVIEKWEQRNTDKGAIAFDGSLIDEAMIKRARQILSSM